MNPIRPAPSKDAPAAAEMSPRERAEARARELLSGGFNPEDSSGGQDEFYVDLDVIPDGWTYEWKRYQTLGMDLASHHVALRKAGWEPVPTSRHPDLMPVGAPGGEAIIRKGMILMERPAVITAQVRQSQDREARMAVRSKEELMRHAPPGTLQRETKDHGNLAAIKKSFGYEPLMEIPE